MSSILKLYFDRKKKKTKSFSVRSLAKKIGVSKSHLADILNGHSRLPVKLLQPILEALEVESERYLEFLSLTLEPEQAEILKLFLPNISELKTKTTISRKVKNRTGDAPYAHEIPHDRFLSNWLYPAILDLTLTKDYDGTSQYLARRLEISNVTTEIILRDLISMGHLKHEDGCWKKTNKKVKYAGASSLANLQHFHLQMLDKAKNLLLKESHPEAVKKRWVTSYFLVLADKTVEQAKPTLIQQIDQIAAGLSQEEGNNLYYLGIQLIPVSKP